MTSNDDNYYSHSITSTPHDSPQQQQQQQLIPHAPPQLSLLKQEILSEEEYVHHLSEIIKRDFFPALSHLETQHELLQAYQSEDPIRIHDSVKRMREICTPTPRRRNRASTPGRTPFATSPSATPVHFDATPSSSVTSSSRPPPASRCRPPSPPPPPRIDPTISLDAFQARYTSEDNSSFALLLARDNALRKEKHAWAWDAERRAQVKAIRGREARERLVDVTRRMVDASEDGTVRMLEGAAGRPAETRLVVEGKGAEGVRVAPEGERLMVEASSSGLALAERGGTGTPLLMIKGAAGGGEAARLSEGEMATRRDKAKGKQRAEEKGQYTDWDKAAAEEQEENKALKRSEVQVPIDSWGFTNRNSLMFPPDADVDPTNPSTFVSTSSSSVPAGGASSSSSTLPALPPGEPKGVRYHATRLEKLEKGASLDSLSSVGGSSVRGGGGGAGAGGEEGSSPSRSRIGAAIAGTPYPAPTSQTPRVSGFSFVSALPTPLASSLPAASLQELMTWGTIEATPVTLRSSGEEAGGPFKIKDTSRRERLAVEMGRRAKRSLSDRAGVSSSSASGKGSGLALNLRRSVLGTPASASYRSPRTPGASSSSGTGTTPRASASDLSPAASALLGRTGQGRALAHGLAHSRGWGEQDEERRRVLRAKERAREVESRERLRRERWTQSPAVSLGFDPDDVEEGVEKGQGQGGGEQRFGVVGVRADPGRK